MVKEKYSSDDRGTESAVDGGFFGDLNWWDISITTAWTIWNDRNLELHDGHRRNPSEVVEFIRSYLLEFQRCQQAVTTRSVIVEQVRWKAPARGIYKINFDGGFQASSRLGGFGAVARDSEGKVLGAIAGPLLMVRDIFAVEALEALKAISWAKDMGFQDVALEGDALTIIRKLNSSSPDLSPIGPYIEEIQSYCSLFRSCIFAHVKRDGNTVANSFAKHGSSLPVNMIWMEEVPASAMDALKFDCNVLP
ncbi:hypothetical protein COLO4_35519 [Corchorus olitorius]|uniref:RNase H type-1 domain-containing protein n=1 Tax=Corchorus olitorius TaxID=93759 RepID=A0A1R3GG08_9ROSI|nr:hypothetical protein COLO4_35519 [Corchorus olitorius]